MKIKITAGTHIGIVGCYGVKKFTIPGINPDQEVENLIRSEFAEILSHKEIKETPTTWKRGTKRYFAFENSRNETAIEWYYTALT